MARQRAQSAREADAQGGRGDGGPVRVHTQGHDSCQCQPAGAFLPPTVHICTTMVVPKAKGASEVPRACVRACHHIVSYRTGRYASKQLAGTRTGRQVGSRRAKSGRAVRRRQEQGVERLQASQGKIVQGEEEPRCTRVEGGRTRRRKEEGGERREGQRARSEYAVRAGPRHAHRHPGPKRLSPRNARDDQQPAQRWPCPGAQVAVQPCLSP